MNLAQQLRGPQRLPASSPRKIWAAALQPTVHSHLRLNVGGRPLHVLSRIADAGLDYSQRTNKFAHHLVFRRGRLPARRTRLGAAPPGLMATSWDGQPRVAPGDAQLPRDERPAGPCDAWEARSATPAGRGAGRIGRRRPPRRADLRALAQKCCRCSSRRQACARRNAGR